VAQREQDLMTLTHQLYGPLTSAKMAVTSLPHLPGDSRDGALRHAAALIEDVMDASYATFNALGLDAGSGRPGHAGDTSRSFRTVPIDAPTELRTLAARLHTTNPRGDLEFAFSQDDDFPPLRVDRRLFLSVLYSLIHNAIKYASPGSTIRLECTFERAVREPALKVKSVGVPIQMHEREHIFTKFGRGYLVSTTGRHHHGIGVGLWAARELMRAIGGDVTLELSPDSPELSIFIVHLPRARGF
jgi:K+-sensing histidine kinase KdpD